MNNKEILTDSLVEIIAEEVLVSIKEDRELFGRRLWAEMIRATAPYERRFTKTMKEFFTEQKKRILANMKKEPKYWKKKNVKDILDFWLFGKREWDERLAKEGIEFLKELIEQEGIRVLQQLQHLTDNELLSIGFNVTNPNVRIFIENYAYSFASEVNNTTLSELRNSLTIGLTLGESMEEIRDRISQIFENATEYRAMMIARSETIRASNAAAEMSYVQSGVVEAKEWHTALDERTCSYCARLHGKIVDLKTNFVSMGDTIEP